MPTFMSGTLEEAFEETRGPLVTDGIALPFVAQPRPDVDQVLDAGLTIAMLDDGHRGLHVLEQIDEVGRVGREHDLDRSSALVRRVGELEKAVEEPTEPAWVETRLWLLDAQDARQLAGLRDRQQSEREQGPVAQARRVDVAALVLEDH